MKLASADTPTLFLSFFFLSFFPLCSLCLCGSFSSSSLKMRRNHRGHRAGKREVGAIPTFTKHSVHSTSREGIGLSFFPLCSLCLCGSFSSSSLKMRRNHRGHRAGKREVGAIPTFTKHSVHSTSREGIGYPQTAFFITHIPPLSRFRLLPGAQSASGECVREARGRGR